MSEMMRTLIAIAALVASVSASSEKIGGPMPSIDYPSATQLKMLEPEPPAVKDPYETTAEFDRRKAESASRGNTSLNFFGELKLSYDADKESYLVEACFKETVEDNTGGEMRSGSNAMGAEWTWFEKTGYRVVVDTGDCTELNVPYELAKAKAIRNEVRAIGEISLTPQEPQRSGRYETAEWGKHVVDGTTTKTYQGSVDRVYVGSYSAGVVAFLDLEEAKQNALREQRKYLEQLEGCPANADQMKAAVRAALDVGDVNFYRALAACPKF